MPKNINFPNSNDIIPMLFPVFMGSLPAAAMKSQCMSLYDKFMYLMYVYPTN